MTSPAVPLDPEDLLADSTWLRALSRGLVRDHFAADDLAQEAWLAALRAHAGTHAAPPDGVERRTWLTGVLRNLAWKQQRTQLRRAARERASARTESLPSSGELVARADMQRALSEAIVALDEPFRTTILLRYMEDLSSAEIARRQNVPEGTVRWRVMRGLAELRESLAARRGSEWLHSCALVGGLVRAPDAVALATGGGTAIALPVIGMQGTSALAAGLALCGAGTAVGVAWFGTASESGAPVITTTNAAVFQAADEPTSEAEELGDVARATRVAAALAVPPVPPRTPASESASPAFGSPSPESDTDRGAQRFQVAVHIARGDVPAAWTGESGDMLQFVLDERSEFVRGSGEHLDETLANALARAGDDCGLSDEERARVDAHVRALVGTDGRALELRASGETCGPGVLRRSEHNASIFVVGTQGGMPLPDALRELRANAVPGVPARVILESAPPR